MEIFAMIVFFVSGLTALACSALASIRKSRRWAGLAIALAAVAGFGLCLAVAPNQPLVYLGAAVLAAIGMAFAVWWSEYLRNLRL